MKRLICFAVSDEKRFLQPAPDDTVLVTGMGARAAEVAVGNSLEGYRPDLIVAASSATTTRLAQNAYAGMTADQVRYIRAAHIKGAKGVDLAAACVDRRPPRRRGGACDGGRDLRDDL